MKQPDVYNLKGRLPIASPFKDPEKMIAIRKQQMEEAKAKYEIEQTTLTGTHYRGGNPGRTPNKKGGYE
jgi:hypothetical protein